MVAVARGAVFQGGGCDRRDICLRLCGGARFLPVVAKSRFLLSPHVDATKRQDFWILGVAADLPLGRPKGERPGSKRRRAATKYCGGRKAGGSAMAELLRRQGAGR